MVVGPGAAMDPRVPQNLTCMLAPLAPFPPALQLRGRRKPLATGHWLRVHNPPCIAAVSGDDRVVHSARPRAARHTSGRVGRQRDPTSRVTPEMLTRSEERRVGKEF